MTAKECAVSELSGIEVHQTTLKSASIIAAGTHRNQQNLPEFCLITAKTSPTEKSDINFELWIPEGDKWNGKLVATGNGGYSSALSYGDMAYALRQGYAVIGGDTGHQTEDMLWGINNPEKIVDWGSRSINSITVAAKAYLHALRAEPAKRSYYLGCSTGGHQGFAEAQRYPEDFDGIIAGAPGDNRTALNIEFMWRFLSNRPANDNVTTFLKAPKLNLLTQRAVEACDTLDGVKDGVIDDPRQCTTAHFNVDALLCTTGDQSSCLTPDELTAAKKIYQGPRNPHTNEQLYPGWALGSESGGPVT